MLFRHRLDYEAAPDRVFAMLADPAFREAACAAQDVLSADVALTRTGNGFTLSIDQQQRTDDLPSFARPFAGSSTRVVQHEVWADSTGGTLRIDSPGQPARISGTITLRPEGSHTQEIVQLDLEVRVPLVGGRLERLLADRIRSAMDAEHGVGVAYLAGGHA
jgi:hypothetical protein